MVNAWSLLYEEINGTMDETYPIKKEGKMSNNDNVNVTIGNTASDDGTIDFTSDVSFGDADTLNIGYPISGSASPDTITFTSNAQAADTVDFGGSHLLGGMGEDHISLSGYAGTAYDDPKYYATKPKPDLKSGSTHKYQEDKGIADLKSYVASTYQGDYTNENSDVQTLDLIHSVGDAESFCRSNALKYLSRYDKKGSAKNDILKAMHYCLLLYYFSGNTQEPDYTNTRYETF